MPIALLSLLLGAAQASTCDVNRGFLTCASPPVTASIDDAASTVVDDYGACGVTAAYTGSQDLWPTVCPPGGAKMEIAVHAACDVDAFVLDGDCDGATSCVAASDAVGLGVDELVRFDCEANHLTWLSVERAPTPAGGWPAACATLGDVRYTVDVTCFETCGDGYDNDVDGLIDCDDPGCVPVLEVLPGAVVPGGRLWTFRVADLDPGDRVIVLGSRGGPTPGPCVGDVCVDLASPRVIGTATADAAGVAEVVRTGPATVPYTVTFQAAVDRGCHVVTEPVTLP